MIVEVLEGGELRGYCGSCAIELPNQSEMLTAMRLLQCRLCGAFNEAPER